ncbi:hypothetical protein [Brevundimonas sp. FT23042]|uniref:hypothetical protein n=1 Tax=Brevundimonas sp. FT23042 TaxID=3393749 RepID=UPI003B586400
MAVLAAATFGAMVTVLITETENPVREWMFALGARPLRLDIMALVFPEIFAWFTFGVALLGVTSLWVMKRDPAIRPSWLVAATAGLFFVATALDELIIGTTVRENWYAYNEAGRILDDGLITPLGWWSAGRRGLVAAVVAGLTAVVFLAVCRPRSKQA